MGDLEPTFTSTDDRARTWLTLAAGLVATVAAVAALITWWPEDGTTTAAVAPEPTDTSVDEPDPPAAPGEPSRTTQPPGTAVAASADLFGGDFPTAFAALRRAAGDPPQILEVAVYDEYAFLAYRDPAAPGHIDRRVWRRGEVGDAEPNPIDDRVDEDTTPALFAPGDLDPRLIARLVADAPSRYDVPTVVSHVLIDRFLPFDDRVRIRVYATPADGRSGGGYVSYDLRGALVDVCC